MTFPPVPRFDELSGDYTLDFGNGNEVYTVEGTDYDVDYDDGPIPLSYVNLRSHTDDLRSRVSYEEFGHAYEAACQNQSNAFYSENER